MIDTDREPQSPHRGVQFAPAQMQIDAPYLLFVGNAASRVHAKTAAGLIDWVPERCLAQIRLGGGVDLGLPDMTLQEAVRAGARTLVIGTASFGGVLPDSWIPILGEALEAGLDIAAGLHERLRNAPVLKAIADRTGRRLIDVRDPPALLPVASGRKRTGRRLLTVGTDCASGKKYTALALWDGLRRSGVDATFRATGQTGILLSGSGIPIDAVVSDFVSGAAEMLSPDAQPDHWDLIEGQGSLFHPAYAAVTLGLIHGSQPDAMVLCHEAGRPNIDGYPDYPLPSFEEAMARYAEAAQLTNPAARFVGVSINTSNLSETEAKALLADSERRTGLPCVDPIRWGVEAIVAVSAPASLL